MATMSDGSENHNQTRDLDESAAGPSSARVRRPSAAEAARERLSGEFAAQNSTLTTTSQEGMPPPPSATPIMFPANWADRGVGNGGDVSTLDVTSQQQPPPNKKRRVNAFFQRCFDATFNPNDATAAQRILAPDSDEEEDEGS